MMRSQQTATIMVGLSLILQGFAPSISGLYDLSIETQVHRSLRSNQSSPTALESVNIFVEMKNCSPWQPCGSRPEIVFHLEKPDVTEHELNMQVKIDTKEYNQRNETSVTIELPYTDEEGLEVEYWVEDDYGNNYFDDSLLMRNLKPKEAGEGYMLEIISEEWEDVAPGGAIVWDVFPPSYERDRKWFEMAVEADELTTSNKLALLAGRLIWNGRVDVLDCADNGLMPSGGASPCGEDRASEQVEKWQNRNNAQILAASKEAGIPPRILKGLIMQESQFWPDWEVSGEYGLGMITSMGTGLALHLNEKFFDEQCNLYYKSSVCSGGYWDLSETRRERLSELVLRDVGTDAEYYLLAETIAASCEMADKMVRNLTGDGPREQASLETMWRIALGVYNAGCGCVYDAMEGAINEQDELDWKFIQPHLKNHCTGAADYFDKVIYYSRL